MLSHLFISNYALIDTLDLDLYDGFSVITGETGAGKSIIMGALNLVMGARADIKSIRTGAAKCIIEATFTADKNIETTTSSKIIQIFESCDLDFLDENIIRREITSAGKSRAFVNDTPINLQQLKAIGDCLIDIHSQHENILLNNTDFQMNIVDEVADNKGLLSQYHDEFLLYIKKKKELSELIVNNEKWQNEKDYALFQYQQLCDANLAVGEQNELENELETLNHAEDIKIDLSSALDRLEAEGCGVVSSLKDTLNSINHSASFLSELSPLSERIQSAYIDMKDVAAELSTIFSNMEYEPNRKLFVEERLDNIYSLHQKHHTSTVEELISIMNDYSDKLAKIDSFDEEISLLDAELKEIDNKLLVFSEAITKSREAVLSKIESELIEKLVFLGIVNSQINIKLTSNKEYKRNGVDEIEFLFSANKNMPLRPIASIASGGEIARVMLALKSITSKSNSIPTIVFDEIDTGVSGEMANRMGQIMKLMSQSIQVITITHLPQIAAMGKNHYKVYKVDKSGITNTCIAQLHNEDRQIEIAEMLSGKNPPQSAMLNALELLK